MGTWGSGNFDSDTAADHLAEVTGRLVSEVEEAMAGDPVELEADEYWGTAVPCNLELLTLLAGRDWVGVSLPEVATVEGWKATYLAAWDPSIDELGPSPEFKAERRAVLERTFDQLIEAIRSK
ncbi:DUF4259 domain-containing protein [Actinoplanes sp. G11-F43]|uniref:DUF4259 domain-containing protein n=1 Tax=Actinoplanes sp. G11-F43 TaxID=3424130 RepID=UPI003D352E06